MIDEIERLTAERDALRADLRDELERADAWHGAFLQTQKHNEELRALLREARNFMPFYTEELRARIDAALNKGGEDEV